MDNINLENKEALQQKLETLRAKDGFICDMDGVIYHGNRLLPGVNEFDQNGQLSPGIRVGAQIFRMGFQNVRQRLSPEGAAGGEGGAVRMGGALPGFRERMKVQILGKVIPQPAAAPQVILPGGKQQKRFLCHNVSHLP